MCPPAKLKSPERENENHTNNSHIHNRKSLSSTSNRKTIRKRPRNHRHHIRWHRRPQTKRHPQKIQRQSLPSPNPKNPFTDKIIQSLSNTHQTIQRTQTRRCSYSHSRRLITGKKSCNKGKSSANHLHLPRFLLPRKHATVKEKTLHLAGKKCRSKKHRLHLHRQPGRHGLCPCQQLHPNRQNHQHQQRGHQHHY